MNHVLASIWNWLGALARNSVLLLMFGGALGTLLRYEVGRWFSSQPWSKSFPCGTLLVNVSGSFILGATVMVIHERLSPSQGAWFLLIGSGFCGAYTTFSTFEWETYHLIRHGSWKLALVNVLANVTAGFVAVLLAVSLVNWLWPRNGD